MAHSLAITVTICFSIETNLYIGFIVSFQGAVGGGLLGLVVSLWILCGATTLPPGTHPTLHAVSTDGCEQAITNTNQWVNNSTLVYQAIGNDLTTAAMVQNDTGVEKPPELLGSICILVPWCHVMNSNGGKRFMQTVFIIFRVGLQRLYSLSYLWYTTIACAVTLLSGSLISLLPREYTNFT